MIKTPFINEMKEGYFEVKTIYLKLEAKLSFQGRLFVLL